VQAAQVAGLVVPGLVLRIVRGRNSGARITDPRSAPRAAA